MFIEKKKLAEYVKLWVLCVFTFGMGFCFALYMPQKQVNNPPNPLSFLTSGTKSDANTLLSDFELDPLGRAYLFIKENYFWFSTVQKERLVEGMIQWMTAALWDKHSLYFNAEETKWFNETIAGNFEWIGAFVGKTQSWVLIRHVFDGSPAKEAKIQDGDIVVRVDSISVADISLEDAVKKIRWPASSKVTLDILRPGNSGEKITQKDGTIQFVVTRRNVKIPSVLAKMEDKNIGVFTIWIFWSNTSEEFLQEYIRLRQEWMKAVIIDLRDNPGWLLSTAVSLLENFVEPGKLLVETKWTRDELAQKYFAQGKSIGDLPMVILVNENSASASEIFAGAMQEYNRAVVVGTTTYGKGSVQEVFPLGSSGEIKVTIAKWYTPMGKGIDWIGINPDIESKVEATDMEKKFDRATDEWKKVLQKLLSGGTVQSIKVSHK